MSAFDVKVGESWKAASNVHVKVDGSWREMLGYYVKIGGAWKGMYSLFPAEATSYTLIENVTAATTWEAPEDGWYQIILFGASGAGGTMGGLGSGAGGGGGGGGCAISRVALKTGDTVVISSLAVGSTAKAVINSSHDNSFDHTLSVTSGANGGEGKSIAAGGTGGTGGTGGVASGGNYANFPGGKGNDGGKFSISDRNFPAGGTGGTAGYTGGRAGGVGAGYSGGSEVEAGSGAKAYMAVYRGNTNVINVVIPPEESDNLETLPTTYNISYDLTNVTLSSNVSEIKKGSSYSATITVSNGYEIKTVKIEMGETDITDSCYSENTISIGEVTGDILITIIAEEIVEESEDIIRIFDSTRSDNFIFGEYEYGASGGTVFVNRTAWPPSSDEDNTSSNQIILYPKPSGMAPVGSMNAYLKLFPNNIGTSAYGENTLFMNNVTYGSYAAGEVAIPLTNVSICMNAYRTKTSGIPTVSYCDADGNVLAQISISNTVAQECSFDTTLVEGGYIHFATASGCGSLVINDIWFK